MRGGDDVLMMNVFRSFFHRSSIPDSVPCGGFLVFNFRFVFFECFCFRISLYLIYFCLFTNKPGRGYAQQFGSGRGHAQTFTCRKKKKKYHNKSLFDCVFLLFFPLPKISVRLHRVPTSTSSLLEKRRIGAKL